MIWLSDQEAPGSSPTEQERGWRELLLSYLVPLLEQADGLSIAMVMPPQGVAPSSPGIDYQPICPALIEVVAEVSERLQAVPLAVPRVFKAVI